MRSPFKHSKIFCACAVVLALFLQSVPEVRAFGNHLDYSFSSNGLTLTGFGNIFNSTQDLAYDVAVQSNGKIIVAGTTSANGGQTNFAVVRYNSDGTLDTTFSGDGKVTTNLSTYDEARSVAVQSDGKIVVAGYILSGTGDDDLIVLRYNTDGTLDTTFNGGLILIDYFDDDQALAVAIAPDGKIVVAGYTLIANASPFPRDWFLVRLNTNGSLDTSFGGAGKVLTQFGGNLDIAYDVIVQPDGKIVACGTTEAGDNITKFAVARYNQNGSLDATFDDDGRVTTVFDNIYGQRAQGLKRTTDGKLIVAGYTGVGTNSDIALARYNSNGSLDTTFDGDGKVLTSFWGYNDVARDVVLQSDGKIVVTGSVTEPIGSGRAFLLVRYKSNGQLDQTFGTGGRVNTLFGDGHAVAQAIAYHPIQFQEDRLIVAGYFNAGEDNNFAVARYRLSYTAAPSDFTDDGRADLAVFRPSTGSWYSYDISTGAVSSSVWGQAGDIPVPGDYDRDGVTDTAVFRQGYWYIFRSGNHVVVSTQFGTAEDKPVQGDYDGDGLTDIAVFRPSTAVWHIQRSALGLWSVQFGVATDKLAQGDYDSDGKTDLAVFRDGYFYLQRSTLGYTAIQWGQAGDRPVPADYDGDGETDLAVFRPSESGWYIKQSQLNNPTSTQWGAATDVPAPADFDGDGHADIAVFRPSSGYWHILQSGTGGFISLAFGQNGDVPIAAAYVPQ